MISSRYLDNFLHPPRISIHRAVLRRILPLWLLLSLLLSAGAYGLELRRVDDFIYHLATEAVQQFEQGSPPALLNSPRATLARQIGLRLPLSQFVGVRLYDINQQLLLEKWGPHDAALPAALGAHNRTFPGPGQSRQSILRLHGHIYVQTLVPLSQPDGRRYGYFSGVYQISPQIMQWIAQSIADTLIGTLIVITLCSLALYPVMVNLNRNTLRLTHSLLSSNIELMRVLGSAIAKRDSDTDSHNYRVTLYALALAQHLQRSEREIIALLAGAFLHDVGKIGIPDAILLKPGPLTVQEFSVMRSHVDIGLDILSEVKWLEMAQEVVGGHHERFDGSGYPRGLSGAQIPFNARLFAIIDVFDALTSVRPYKPAFAFEHAMEIMRSHSGSHFDPALLTAFEGMAAGLYQRYHDAQTPWLRQQLARARARYFARSARDAQDKPAAAAT